MSTLQDMFDKALDEFRDRVGEKEYRDFQSADLHKLKRELNKLQQDQRKPKSLRNLRRLESFMKAFEQFGSVVEVFLNCSPIVCFVWGPIKYLLLVRVAETVSPGELYTAYDE